MNSTAIYLDATKLDSFSSHGSFVEVSCSGPTCGGKNYILKWNFFGETILADRYIHRIEMLVVSIKSSSSVEFENKTIF